MDENKKQRRAKIKASLQHRGEYKFEDPAMEAEITQASIEMEKELAECHVNFRWNREQIEQVKRIAEGMGVPYQTYIKTCVARQMKQDLHGAGISTTELLKLNAEMEQLRQGLASCIRQIHALKEQQEASPAPAQSEIAVHYELPGATSYTRILSGRLGLGLVKRIHWLDQHLTMPSQYPDMVDLGYFKLDKE